MKVRDVQVGRHYVLGTGHISRALEVLEPDPFPHGGHGHKEYAVPTVRFENGRRLNGRWIRRLATADEVLKGKVADG